MAGNNGLQPHPSLPDRPKNTPPPIRAPNAPGQRGYGNTNVGYGNYDQYSGLSSAPPYASVQPNAMMGGQVSGAGYGQPMQYPSTSYYPPDYTSGTSTPAVPLINNPFAHQIRTGPGTGFDPELQAQLAEWNSGFILKDDATKKSGPPRVVESAEAKAGTDGKKEKTVVRHGGGKSWEDPSLLDWDPSHPRLFVGNLAGEVTDDSLMKAFSRYASVQKTRVVRDKRTTKSKGYGFVSFSNTDDFFRAAKEMQGKYIGSHPVTIKRAVTNIKPSTTKKNDKNNGGKHDQTDKNSAYQGAVVAAGPVPAGVKKPSKKKQPTIRMLG